MSAVKFLFKLQWLQLKCDRNKWQKLQHIVLKAFYRIVLTYILALQNVAVVAENRNILKQETHL